MPEGKLYDGPRQLRFEGFVTDKAGLPTFRYRLNAEETQPVAVCVMTDENKDKRWVTDNAGNLLCAKVAKAVYDHFAEK